MVNFKTGYFKNDTVSAFSYSFERVLAAGETILLKMPVVSSNKRGVNDIGFTAEDGITLYATLSARPENDSVTVWQEIRPYDEINKTTAYIKIVNNSGDKRRVNIRALLN